MHASCTLDGCSGQGDPVFQNFCSLSHLKRFSHRYVDPHVTQTPKGGRVFFYDRNKHKQNYEFSNFFPTGVVYEGIKFKNAEQAFQYAKFSYGSRDPRVSGVAQAILHAHTPKEAAEIAKANKSYVDPRWHQNQSSGFTRKEDVMFEIVKDKFVRHDNLRQKLLKTGQVRLVEDSPVDDFWGRGANGKGENKLGRILMKIRSDMQQRKY